jgi:hypothetical protein
MQDVKFQRFILSSQNQCNVRWFHKHVHQVLALIQLLLLSQVCNTV